MKTLAGKFAHYVSLNVLGMIALSVYILADTYFIANGVGVYGIAALNFAIVVFNCMHAFGLMVGMGAATRFQIYKVQGNNLMAKMSFCAGLILVLLGVMCVYLVGVVYTQPVALFLGAGEDTLDLTVVYLRTLCLASPLFLLNDLCLPFVRNDGAARLAMIAMLAGSFGNIVLDYIFIYIFHWGMFGAAFATCFAPLMSLIILVVHVRKGASFWPIPKLKSIQAALSESKMCWSSWLVLNTKLGFSSSIVEVSSAFILFVFNLILLSFAGDTGVAAYGIIANLAFVATAIFVGIGQGVQPLASELYALGKQKSLQSVALYTIVLAFVLALVLQVLVLIGNHEFVAAFNESQDVSLQVLAEEGMTLYFWGYFFAGINIVMAAFLSAIEHSRQAWILSFVRGCVATLVAALVLVYLLGIVGVWIAFPVGEAFSSLLLLYFLYTLKRKTHANASTSKYEASTN